MIGPARKCDIESHTPDGIRKVRSDLTILPSPPNSGKLRPNLAILPSPPNSGELQVVLPHDLENRDHSGQEDAAFKKKIDENITSIPTPDSISSPKRKRSELLSRVLVEFILILQI
jgi:hypothetical protein